jgi:hypothetical protein
MARPPMSLHRISAPFVAVAVRRLLATALVPPTERPTMLPKTATHGSPGTREGHTEMEPIDELTEGICQFCGAGRRSFCLAPEALD